MTMLVFEAGSRGLNPYPRFGCLYLSYLYRESCLSNSFKRLFVPVGLANFFPHNRVKFAAALKTEDQSEIIVILFSIHVDCAVVIHSSKILFADCHTRITIFNLEDLFALYRKIFPINII